MYFNKIQNEAIDTSRASASVCKQWTYRLTSGEVAASASIRIPNIGQDFGKGSVNAGNARRRSKPLQRCASITAPAT